MRSTTCSVPSGTSELEIKIDGEYHLSLGLAPLFSARKSLDIGTRTGADGVRRIEAKPQDAFDIALNVVAYPQGVSEYQPLNAGVLLGTSLTNPGRSWYLGPQLSSPAAGFRLTGGVSLTWSTFPRVTSRTVSRSRTTRCRPRRVLRSAGSWSSFCPEPSEFCPREQAPLEEIGRFARGENEVGGFLPESRLWVWSRSERPRRAVNDAVTRPLCRTSDGDEASVPLRGALARSSYGIASDANVTEVPEEISAWARKRCDMRPHGVGRRGAEPLRGPEHEAKD